MRIALIGYGKMGQAIEKTALERGHSISVKIDDQNRDQLVDLSPENTDVAIEFSMPVAASENVRSCISSGIPIVSGTTGWNEQMPEIIEYCNTHDGTFFYASNFSLGVNILFEINRKLASIMNRMEDYSVSMKETHHIHKLDSPSGTAITLADDIINNIDRLKEWKLGSSSDKNLGIEAIREGEVSGTHIVNYDNNVDRISIGHESKSRQGFALGAVLVSEWVRERKGFLTMKDFLDL
jgi:4-hydroxy-tetrahydrodipicolinate reductase